MILVVDERKVPVHLAHRWFAHYKNMFAGLFAEVCYHVDSQDEKFIISIQPNKDVPRELFLLVTSLDSGVVRTNRNRALRVYDEFEARFVLRSHLATKGEDSNSGFDANIGPGERILLLDQREVPVKMALRMYRRDPQRIAGLAKAKFVVCIGSERQFIKSIPRLLQ